MGQERRVGHHPVIRPDSVAVHMPGAVQDLDRLGKSEPMYVQSRTETCGLHDARRVGHDDPAGVECLGRVGNDLPRLREVEDDPVVVAARDALVRVPHLDVVPTEGIVAQHGGDVGHGTGREVVANLVAGDHSSCPEKGH